jgi:hypothetical protein
VNDEQEIVNEYRARTREVSRTAAQAPGDRMSYPATNIGDDYMQSMMERVLVGDIIQIIPRPKYDWGDCLFVVDEIIPSGEVRAHHRFQDVVAYVLFAPSDFVVKGRV